MNFVDHIYACLYWRKVHCVDHELFNHKEKKGDESHKTHHTEINVIKFERMCITTSSTKSPELIQDHIEHVFICSMCEPLVWLNPWRVFTSTKSLYWKHVFMCFTCRTTSSTKYLHVFTSTKSLYWKLWKHVFKCFMSRTARSTKYLARIHENQELVLETCVHVLHV